MSPSPTTSSTPPSPSSSSTALISPTPTPTPLQLAPSAETTTTTTTTSSSSSSSSSSSTEPSELPSLRRQHHTAGYRDGLVAAKHAHVQRGFDAWFPVGAQLGVRAGVVLGVLEGMGRCASNAGGAGAGTVDVAGLYAVARRELAVSGVFGGVVREEEEEGAEEVVVVGERLERVGEEVVARWEGVVMGLLGERR
ncbi:Essential protein Yae1, N terminal [Emydomyces testavorans]|uniref:Protein YAE1 n=1 Tax=Emydomyces testavorans TaxID=2070801 RepID=A0AAF0DKT9_9EURO|nr:Essential protein Yae1, N terminal [Emydomyces testavorans]